MLINEPERIPGFHPFHENMDAMTDACLAIMRDLGISSAYGVNSANLLEWSNTFFGDPPTIERLVEVAERHGYDVLYGIETFDDDDGEWAAAFRSRSPRVIREKAHKYDWRADDLDCNNCGAERVPVPGEGWARCSARCAEAWPADHPRAEPTELESAALIALGLVSSDATP